MSDPINDVAPPLDFEIHVDLTHPFLTTTRTGLPDLQRTANILARIAEEVRQTAQVHGEVDIDGRRVAWWVIHTDAEE